MPLDPHPFFRKAIVPWYDSDAVCIGVIVLMGLVLLFGFLGVHVAQHKAGTRGDLWVPLLLVLSSGGVILSTAARMIRRR